MSTISENDPISTEPNTVEFSKEDVSESNLLGVARINIVNVKNLNSDTLDVRITCLESGNKYSKTHVCENINSKWNQVFYIPIYNIDNKLKIRVCDIAFFRSISLGSYIFNPKNFIEGKKLDLEHDLIKPKNSILPRPNKGNLRFDADFYSFSNREFITKTTKFSKTIIFFYSLCNLITQNDSVKLDKLAILFNFNSEKELKELIKTFVDTINDEKVKTISDNILIAALFKASLWNEKDYVPYMNHVMWNSYNIYENYLKTIDKDIEERLYNLAKKFIIKHFKTSESSWVSWVGEAIQSATIDVSQSTKIKKSKLIKKFAVKFAEEFVIKFTDLVRLKLKPESAKKLVSYKVDVTIGSLHEQTKDSLGKNTTDTVVSTLINLKSETTIVENQKPDGSIKLDKTVSDQINISSDNIKSSIQTYGVSDKLKSLPKNVWETALSLRYLNITSQSQDQHKEQFEKAKKYLIEELKDEKLVEELLTTSEKIIVDQSIKKGKEDAVSTIKSSTTTEKAKQIVSSQKEDGSLELPDTISKALDVESNESLVSSTKTYFIGKGTKAPENKKVIDTAITLSFLRKTSSTDASQELKEKVAKAEKYLKTELGSEEKIKELLEKTDTRSQKLLKFKNEEGSYDKISDQITEKLGEITTENISSSVRITDERVKNLDTKVWDTFITIAYCNKMLGKHQSKMTTQKKRALAWLRTQIKDEKLEKEILESCEKLVVEKAFNKKKESILSSLSSWGSDTAKSTEENLTDSLVSHVERCLKYEGDEVPKNQYLRENKQLLHTAIILYFLKTKHIPPELKEKYEKAVKYLRIELESDNSEKVMDRISMIINIVRAMKEAEEKGLVNRVLTDTAKFTEEVIRDALSCQRVNGSLQFSDTVSKKLKFESLVSHVERCLESEGDKVPKNQRLRDNKQLLHTAIIFNFLETKHIPPELKEKYEKAVKYLITELESDFKKVTDRINMIINTATKEVEEKELVTKVLTDIAKFTKEVIHDALSCQRNDGSLQLSDTVSKELKFESLVLHVTSCLESEGDKMHLYLRNEQLMHTAIILNFLKTTHIQPELKEKYEKAMEYLKTKLGSDFEEVMNIISMMIMIINTVRTMKEAEGKGLVTKFFDYLSSMVNNLYK
ncbi:unnamed protein product [Rhizophagus irregularis]|nr:unnamed protein product [Rhizophagus irregularis]